MKIDFAAKRKTADVEVSELNVSIRLRALSIGQINEIAALPDSELKILHQLAKAIIDPENGATIYTVDELQEMSSGVCAFLADELGKLHGKGKSAEIVAKN